MKMIVRKKKKSKREKEAKAAELMRDRFYRYHPYSRFDHDDSRHSGRCGLDWR